MRNHVSSITVILAGCGTTQLKDIGTTGQFIEYLFGLYFSCELLCIDLFTLETVRQVVLIAKFNTGICYATQLDYLLLYVGSVYFCNFFKETLPVMSCMCAILLHHFVPLLERWQ